MGVEMIETEGGVSSKKSDGSVGKIRLFGDSLDT